MNGRKIILGRIREALLLAAPHPNEAHGIHPAASKIPLPAKKFETWLPDSGDGLEQQIQKFAALSETLKTRFIRVSQPNDILEHLQTIRQREYWKTIAAHHGELTDQIVGKFDLPCLFTNEEYDTKELEASSVGITECDALVAQTGSVLLSTHSAGGRALSVLPPHHIVLARESQIVPDLSVALEQAAIRYRKNMPSYLGFITGPSRTGDIERILVLGAHGPKMLTVFCLKDS